MANAARVGTGVGVVLLKEGKLLLGRRTEGFERGTWSMPGGKIESGETLEETAKREVLEETGIIVRAARVICVNNDIGGGKHFVTVGLFADSFVGEPKVVAPDEIDSWGWFALDKLPTPLFFPSRNVLDCYLAGRVNKC